MRSTPSRDANGAETWRRTPLRSYAPAPLDSFLDYPGRAPSSSFIFTPEGVVELADDAACDRASRFLRAARSIGIDRRIPVLCSGSNANPAQIERKLHQHAGDRIVPFLRARVDGANAVFSAHAASYGAIPATLDRVETPSAATTFCVGFYTPPQLAAVDASENRNYHLALAHGVSARLAGDDAVFPFYLFASRHGVLSLDRESSVPLGACTQRELLDRLFRTLDTQHDLPSLEVYLRRPRDFAGTLSASLRRAGLRRSARLHHEPVVVDSARAYGELRDA